MAVAICFVLTTRGLESELHMNHIEYKIIKSQRPYLNGKYYAKFTFTLVFKCKFVHNRLIMVKIHPLLLF